MYPELWESLEQQHIVALCKVAALFYADDVSIFWGYAVCIDMCGQLWVQRPLELVKISVLDSAGFAFLKMSTDQHFIYGSFGHHEMFSRGRTPRERYSAFPWKKTVLGNIAK